MDLNHFLRRRQRRRRQRRQPAIARPTPICAPSPPGGPASGAHRSECGGRSDGRRSTCPRALGRGGLWRARERWRRWPRPAGRTPRSACRAPPPRAWFSRSCLTKSEDKLPKVPLLKYYTYNLGATAQVLSAGGPGLIAPGGTPGKIKLACTRRYGVTFWRQIRSI